MIPTDPQLSKRLGSALSVPSPLLSAEALAKADAGEGQGEGCGTARSMGSSSWEAAALLRTICPKQTSLPGLPPSPTLPRKGGGSAAVPIEATP